MSYYSEDKEIAGSDTNDQFTIPTDPSYYHKIDLHDHQKDVPVHYNRAQLHRYDEGRHERHHSKKYYERERLLHAIRKGDAGFVKNFIQEKGFLKPTADPETDINRYFVHRRKHSHHHDNHHETSGSHTSNNDHNSHSTTQPRKKNSSSRPNSRSGSVDKNNNNNSKYNSESTTRVPTEEDRPCLSSDEEELDLKDESESSNTGMNILLEAVHRRRTNVVKELLKIPNIATEQRDPVSGCTALLLAAQQHDLETLTVLLDDEKNNPTGKPRVNKAATCETRQKGLASNVSSSSSLNHFAGFSVLMFACHSHGFATKTSKSSDLLPQSSDHHHHHSQSSSSASSASSSGLQLDQENSKIQVQMIRQILLHAGFDINHQSDDERTAIFIACGHCMESKIIEVLIRAGAKFSASDREPSSMKYRHHLKSGATAYDGGSYPLHQCIKFGKYDNLRVLLNSLPDDEARDEEVNVAYGSYRITPLILAVSGASDDDVAVPSSGEEERLRFRSDREEEQLDQEARERLKSLRVESRQKVFFEMVKLLVENGADTAQEGGLRDELPIEIAKREKHLQIAEFLSSHHHHHPSHRNKNTKNHKRTINLESIVEGSRAGGVSGDAEGWHYRQENSNKEKRNVSRIGNDDDESSSSSSSSSESSYSLDDAVESKQKFIDDDL